MKKITLVIIIVIYSFSLYSQTQVGSTIYSKKKFEAIGSEIDLSFNGKRIMVAGPKDDSIAYDAGTVHIYDEVENEWILLYEINGTKKDENFGENIAMTPDGKRFFATGRISTSDYFIIVYGEQNGVLELIGDTIVIPSEIRDLVVSENGDRIAVASEGDNGFEQGILQIYDLVNSQWQLMPFSIYGDEYNSLFGEDIDMTADGTRIIIGDRKYNKDFSQGGRVKVYDLIEEEWVQIGQTFLGDQNGENLGYQVNISKEGNVIAIVQMRQFTSFDDPTANLNVYELIDDAWILKGETILGTEDFRTITFEIDLSDNGEDLILGEYRYGEEYWSGKAIHYRFLNDQWEPSEVAIYGESEHDQLGNYVSISGDGTRFAAGAPNGIQSTYVKVYEYNNIAHTSKEDFSENWEIYPNPSTGNFTIYHEIEKRQGELVIFNQVGAIIYSTSINSSVTSLNIDLPVGFYFLDLSFRNNHSIKKLSIIN